jgi:valyl-tRNA synthetase
LDEQDPATTGIDIIAQPAGKKLQNEAFLSQAPADVVAAEREKQADYQGRVDKLTKSLEQLLGW